MIKDVVFHTDELMAFMSGSLVLYWAIKFEITIRDYLLIIVGISSLYQLKESYGTVCLIFVAIFIFSDEIDLSLKEIKKQLLRLIVILFSPILGLFLSLETIEKPFGYYTSSSALELPVLNL